jgi:anti-sigma B factor antagonist/stage II sporulation protein AA (anti-sigma F factor antagonist)
MPLNENIAAVTGTVKQGVLVLAISGRLDAVTTPSIEKKAFEAIHKGHNRLLVDCSSLEYISSAGMRMLLSISKKLKNVGVMALCNVSGNVLDVLKMAGFDHVLTIEQSEESALRTLTTTHLHNS